ncbi:hypothetical protein M0657_010049 [Pyricularia oryzae]|uniref:SET domain-containing protein n=1 Tax=Pyricularia oryzae (strain Y34) TaxID=1143189 RepID=A0AA97NPJ2_PYRO3|nr:hypothetical protein OOU_Y34scaffold00824g3 [Pyricularia oryzae Y34]KAI7913398.1 hypothetical protein M0657_010049 [Pyricularia oryzae]
MTEFSELLGWASAEGLILNGIQPAWINGCGKGIVACRELKAEEAILIAPIQAIRSITTVSRDLIKRLPPSLPLHGILAAELALTDTSTPSPWQKSLPAMADITATLPFMWPKELQKLLPTSARVFLENQQTKYNHEWNTVSQAMPSISEERFQYYWHIVNTRTFLYEVSETECYSWEDRLALVPLADIFNHADEGCRVSYMPEHYVITTDRAYEAGEELFISYGDHSNDCLLTEYGFLLPKNRWDIICIDEVVLPRLDESAKELLRQRDLLGDYTLHAEKGPCSRVQAALRLLCCSYEHWLKYVEGRDDGFDSQHAVNVLLCELIGKFEGFIRRQLHMIEQTPIGIPGQREILGQRWRQIDVIAKQIRGQLSS